MNQPHFLQIFRLFYEMLWPSFGAWLERHYDFIYRIAWRVTGHQMDAEDSGVAFPPAQ